MAGELLGLQFGTYTGMIREIGNNYDIKFATQSKQKGNQNEFKYYDKNTNHIRGNGYKEAISFSEYNQPLYADSVIFKNGLQYGTSSKDNKKLDTFDYIVDKDKFAIDLNGNGKVDANEIFAGKFDQYVYKKAKDSGDLSNYNKYLKDYNH